MSTLSLDDFSLDEPLLPDLGDTEPFTVDDYVVCNTLTEWNYVLILVSATERDGRRFR